MTALRCLLAFLFFAVGLAILANAPAHAETCDAATSEFQAARTATDLPALIAAYTKLSGPDVGCDTRVIHCAGDSVARAHVAASYAAADRGGTPEEVRGILEKGRAFGSPWQLLIGLGDVSFAQARTTRSGQDYELAASEYQDALNVLNEDSVCADFGEPSAPGPDAIEPVHKRMTEALLLAPQFELVRTREGGCGGVFLASIRGFTPKFRPIPITFVFGEANFTPEGEKAAATLLACVKEEKYVKIVLSGHTDDIGADAYNMALSKRRVDKVAAYLKAGGFAGKIEPVAMGKREPFQADDPTAYSDDEIRQLNRRVVLRETDK